MNVQDEISDIQKLLADVRQEISNEQNLLLNIYEEILDIQELFLDVRGQLANE